MVGAFVLSEWLFVLVNKFNLVILEDFVRFLDAFLLQCSISGWWSIIMDNRTELHIFTLF